MSVIAENKVVLVFNLAAGERCKVPPNAAAARRLKTQQLQGASKHTFGMPTVTSSSHVARTPLAFLALTVVTPALPLQLQSLVATTLIAARIQSAAPVDN
eukprot:11842-Chlamydomonas_euryale.AAC.1